MERDWGQHYYSSVFVEDRKNGFAGFELHRSSAEKKERVARVIYWDASSQFSVETFSTDIPLGITEALITETKERIKLG